MNVIYKIKCPKTDFILYVGKTESYERRKKEHLQGNFGHIGKYIKKLLSIGFDPIFEELEICENEESPIREGFWVKELNPLLNIASTGATSVKRRTNSIRKTKYPFSTISVGGAFVIASEDFNSMATSLRQFNSRHSKQIQIEAEDGANESSLIIKRVK